MVIWRWFGVNNVALWHGTQWKLKQWVVFLVAHSHYKASIKPTSVVLKTIWLSFDPLTALFDRAGSLWLTKVHSGGQDWIGRLALRPVYAAKHLSLYQWKSLQISISSLNCQHSLHIAMHNQSQSQNLALQINVGRARRDAEKRRLLSLHGFTLDSMTPHLPNLPNAM